jgi:hypothetical protein
VLSARAQRQNTAIVNPIKADRGRIIASGNQSAHAGSIIRR